MFYHIKNDAGKMFGIEADNAGQAIARALHKKLGTKVVECYSGDSTGRINYDIPPHEPCFKKTRLKKPIQTELFQ